MTQPLVLLLKRRFSKSPPVWYCGKFFPLDLLDLETARNKLMFEKRSLSAQEVMVQSITAMKEWELAQPRPPTAAPKPMHAPRSPNLPPSTVFCNSDASWKKGSAGLALIFTDQVTTELARKSISLDHVTSPVMAEALVIKGALLHAATLNYTHICLRSDSKVLIRAISQRKWTTKLFGVLSGIDSLAFSPSSPFLLYLFAFNLVL